MEPVEIIEALHAARQEFYESLSTFETFGKGWTRRNDETKEQALLMV
jgi:lysozyme family protein